MTATSLLPQNPDLSQMPFALWTILPKGRIMRT
ncbi:hypothetical protein FHR32_002435 [Streptosporangium album]|uniref:Uncharacterized protein n=1 Tax=Streptosporangium album TaxID=47479 RepID=A0A7W7W9K1_9ACTN|nr:hypothetical protein [Streptosporangium album]